MCVTCVQTDLQILFIKCWRMTEKYIILQMVSSNYNAIQKQFQTCNICGNTICRKEQVLYSNDVYFESKNPTSPIERRQLCIHIMTICFTINHLQMVKLTGTTPNTICYKESYRLWLEIRDGETFEVLTCSSDFYQYGCV